jgi:hypothetical protein
MENKISEFFNYSTSNPTADWNVILKSQYCGYINKKCVKTRKSDPSISIGTCTVKYGEIGENVIICPYRLLENRRIFLDCIHLLTLHEPGNDLHLISEISIPGGSVDYFLVSTKNSKVVDFVGIELQTLDTTGTVWPQRQSFLKSQGLSVPDSNPGTFGMNWKMTAKTTLVQLHHKITTFEHLNKKFVLVLQNHLLNYMQKQFSFSHISQHIKIGDSMHFHSYKISLGDDKNYHLSLDSRLSTDAAGIAACMGLQAEAQVEMEILINLLQSKISPKTVFSII